MELRYLEQRSNISESWQSADCDINREQPAGDGQTQHHNLNIPDMDAQDKVGGNNNTLPAEVSTDELELLKKLEEANR